MAQQPPFYRVIIEDPNGKQIVMKRFSSLKFSYSLNRSSSAELVVPIRSVNVTELTTASLKSWLRVYRWDDENDPGTERLVWYGLLTDPSYDLQSSDAKLVLRYSDLAGLLERRHVARDFSVTTPTDASQILWDLIEQSQERAYLPVSGISGTFQYGERITGGSSTESVDLVRQASSGDYLMVRNPTGALLDGELLTGDDSGATATAETTNYTIVGDLGIVQGSAPASKNRQPEKDLQNRTILDVMQAFSEYEDGIDWEITPTPRNQSIGFFNTYYAGIGQQYHKGNEIDTPLTYYVDDTEALKFNNLQSVSVDEEASEYVNEMLILGATDGESQIGSSDGNAQQQIAFGLFEEIKSETSISEQDTLDDRAAEELASKSVIPFRIKAKLLPLQRPRFGTFDVGDIFTVRVRYYGFRNFTAQYRLYKMTVSVDDTGIEKLDLTLDNI